MSFNLLLLRYVIFEHPCAYIVCRGVFMPKSNNIKNSRSTTMALQCIISLLFIVLLTSCFLCIAAKVLCMIDVPADRYIPMSTSIAAAAILFGSCLSMRHIKAYCMPQALICALLCWCIVVTISCAHGQRIDETAFLKLFLFLSSAAVGCFLGKCWLDNSKKRRHVR